MLTPPPPDRPPFLSVGISLTSNGGKSMNHNDELIGQWLAWLAGGNPSPNTLRLRRCLVTVFAREHDLTAASSLDVQQYLADLPGSAHSKASHLASLRGFYRWAARAGHILDDPTNLVHGIKVPRGIPKPVPIHVVETAIAEASDETRLMLLLGAYAGLRRSEIASLHADCVSETHLTIKGKGGKVRRIPIHPRLRPELTFTGWAFESPQHRGEHVRPPYVAVRVAAILGEPWTCHCLRHAFATRAYRGTHDIRAVQYLLGHSSPDVTARYVAAEQDSLEAAVASIA